MINNGVATNREKLAGILEEHQTLVVVGANWGDEGKGKVIDLIMGHYDIVARFSGGANAGHTVYTPEGKKLVSHLLPTGLAQNKICVLGRGEFFNLELFLQELEDSKKIVGDVLPPIYVDQQAPLWTPYHKLFESYVESLRGVGRIGTTSKGIGPLEGFYKLRIGPVVGYLFEPKLLEQSLKVLYEILKPCLEVLKNRPETETIPTPEEVLQSLLKEAPRLKEFISDTSYFLRQSLDSGKRILLEGAQATGLDAWWGTYPFVSAGNSVSMGAALGTGLPSQEFGSTILVAKTLPTRVGNGPMPSEMWERQAAMGFVKDHLNLFAKGPKREEFLQLTLQKINSGAASNAEMSQYFQVLGDERGATTGRGRSLGFLDIPWLHYAIRINKPKYLALTRFDMLSGVKAMPVLTAYKFMGDILPKGKLPPVWHMDKIEPVFEQWQCFAEDIGGTSQADDFPVGAKNFIARLEKELGVPILLVGTGPGREAMVVRVTVHNLE